jgi:hypothetical protein
MKTVLKVIGVVLVCVAVLLLVLRTAGFEPGDHTPGLWLRGKLVTAPVNDWSFTDKYSTIEIQTRTRYLLPHSVTTGCVAYNGQLYVTSGYAPGVEWPHGTRWNENVARDPHVRLKIGDQLYDRTLVHVTDPAEKAGVFKAREEKYHRVVLHRSEVVRVMPD